MSGQGAPFLDIKSFVANEVSQAAPERALAAPMSSAFLSVYELEDGLGFESAATDEYATFLSELYDEEFDDAVSQLIDEASAIYEAQFEGENPVAVGYQAERLLEQHFAPLVRESEALFEALSKELGQHNLRSLSEEEVETFVDRYEPAEALSPNFEDFFGKLKNAVTKVAKKGLDLAKKGVAAAAKLGLGPVLDKIKTLLKPLFQRVIQTAIGKLPAALQPIAQKLAKQLPFLKEFEESGTAMVSEIQSQFNQEVANVLFASNETEQNLEVARALSRKQAAETYPLAELDGARDRFAEGLLQLKEGEDATPHVESFIPAILPALKIGINLIGRKKVVDFLANLLGKLIQKFVGPKYAPALSQAIVDAGLRLIQLEATPEDESRAAADAVVGTVEETVQRIAALPAFVLEDQELLEGFAVQAFEQAAAANLPPVLPEETYQKRPELGEARKLRGVWVQRPGGAKKRYKKFSRKVPVKLTPRKVTELSTFEGVSLGEVLEDEFGVAPGEEIEALVHLYEATAGTRLPEVARLEEDTPGLNVRDGYTQLQPFTREAAELLFGDPELGRGPNAAMSLLILEAQLAESAR